MARILGFPNPVNETSARIVATGAVVMGVLFLATGSGWVLIPMTYGFWARVLTGPKLSPLGRLSTQVITPRLAGPHKFVPGPPKRFAQGIGATFTTVASVLYLLNLHTASLVVIGMLVIAASLEAFVGYCLGCAIFGQLMRFGIIPEDVCEACNNLSVRVPVAS